MTTDWEAEKILMQREFRRLKRELGIANTKASRAHELMIAAQTRAHDAKNVSKGLKNGLARCELDARRYQWMRRIGLRFVGVAAWLHEREADARVDAQIAAEGRGPTQTERHATTSTHAVRA